MKKRIMAFFAVILLILLASFSPLPPGEWPAPGAGDFEGNENFYPRSEIDGMEMIFIPAAPLTEHQRDLEGLITIHVIKGGSWQDDPENLRITNRATNIYKGTFEIIGFRCAVSAEDFPIK